MNTVIFRTIAPYLVALMMVFSVFVLLRGHNEPGGGFIGGLIAASALAMYGIASGVSAVRKAIVFHPLSVAGFGVLLASLAGFASLFAEVPFLMGLWATITLPDGTEVAISTPLFFDIGVYLVVLGVLATVALALEEDDRSL
ncbi:Na+/H+ antiporter subunit B [Cucumibacter marinus]|uniref:Na+/H+ antiporter subunit B n=1 Tax=Cucumibacter marinus TaxID=1121252 RepID=UPI0004252946|nr:Na+/H+ antiporter subunit B [Cucumibacter marinus]